MAGYPSVFFVDHLTTLASQLYASRVMNCNDVSEFFIAAALS
jgi:hypothetical protein